MDKSTIYKRAVMKVAAQDLLGQWNASVNRSKNKGKAGTSGTYPDIINIKDKNSYSSQPQANPNAKNIDLSGVDKSQYTTTSECVKDLMDDHGADRQTAVNYCTSPGITPSDNNDNGNGNGNTKSASVQPDFVKIHNSLFPEQ